MLHICITFDYELFLGKNNGTAKEVLFDPTDKLIRMLNEEGVSATFFADTCSITQHQRYGIGEYVRNFSEQIQTMYKMDQDVQLHIHSHWLESEYKNEEWIFDSKSYRLQSFGFDESVEENVYSIIRSGREYLESTIQKVAPEYRCIAYRAGGFTLQPHQELIKALYKEGIRIDSSIAPMLSSGGANSYEYTHVIQNVNWNISSDNEWWIDSNNTEALYEIPVATENKNPFCFLLKRIFCPQSIKLNLGTKRGSYINAGNVDSRKKVSVINYISCYNALSLDAYKAEFLYKQLIRYYKKHHCNEKDATIAIIGHPKLVIPEYINNLQSFIQMIKKDNRFQFCNIGEVYNWLVMEKKVNGNSKKI